MPDLSRFNKSWFALHVKPRAEKSVSVILKYKGYDQFVPTRARRSGRHVDQPLFPGYVFCRFGSDVLGPIVTTPGVIRILGAGSVPIAIPETEIDAIRQIVDSGVRVRPYPYLNSDFHEGAFVRVCEGPLRGIEGKILRAGKNSVLIFSVNALQRSVEVDLSSIMRVDPGPADFCRSLIPTVAAERKLD
jgi:transcriptional antiterminator NusG